MARQTSRKRRKKGASVREGCDTARRCARDNPNLAPCGIAAVGGCNVLWCGKEPAKGRAPCQDCAGCSFPKQHLARKSRHLVGWRGRTSLGIWIKGTLQGLRQIPWGLCLANAGTTSQQSRVWASRFFRGRRLDACLDSLALGCPCRLGINKRTASMRRGHHRGRVRVRRS